ncbi:hypothetical protein BCV70DRAFT_223259 [Testicularia cyperi]|uniref:Zn(2)-C6 fungal-type domain-containing protein n=1 Tax=Testicularia cyperi TaxID=1882483 RepID=A0A317XR40_9BASI|nr:hypothetical protein BCV70DRAFT_223259 [Testicularia cyperi]
MPYNPNLSPPASCKSGESPVSASASYRTEEHSHEETNPNLIRSTVEGSIRKRVYRACEVCRRKKVKCNGQKPCSHCVAFAEDCYYVDTKDRSAYSRRYVESLEQRLAKMEQALTFALDQRQVPSFERHFTEQGRAQMHLTGHARQSAAGSLPSHVTVASSYIVSQYCVGGTLDLDNTGTIRFMGKTPAAVVYSDINGFLSSGASRAGVQQTGTVRPAPSLGLFGCVPSTPVTSMGLDEARSQLPQDEVIQTLVEAFFCCSFPVFPVVSHATLMQTVSQILFSPKRDDLIDTLTLALVFAVLACGERAVREGLTGGEDPPPRPAPNLCSSHSGVAADRLTSVPVTTASPNQVRAAWATAGHHYYQQSQSLVNQVLPVPSRLVIVQIYALQAFYLSDDASTARAWLLSGDAMRMAIDLGLHRRLEHPSCTLSEQELRKRVFWSVYILDRKIGILLGRPPSIEDGYIDNDLSALCDDEFKDMADGFASLVDLSRISGRVAKTTACMELARQKIREGQLEEQQRLLLLTSQARSHETALENWLECLPAPLKCPYPPEAKHAAAVQSCAALTALHMVRLRLLQSVQGSLLTPSGSVTAVPHAMPGDGERLELAKITQAALELIRAASRVAATMSTSPWLMEYINALLVGGGSLVLVAARYRHTNALQLLNDADECIEAIRSVERDLSAARDHRKVLSRMLRKVREHLGLGNSQGYLKRSASHLAHHASMRSEAPGYDSGMGKRPRASTIPSTGGFHGITGVTASSFSDQNQQQQQQQHQQRADFEAAVGAQYARSMSMTAAESKSLEELLAGAPSIFGDLNFSVASQPAGAANRVDGTPVHQSDASTTAHSVISDQSSASAAAAAAATTSAVVSTASGPEMQASVMMPGQPNMESTTAAQHPATSTPTTTFETPADLTFTGLLSDLMSQPQFGSASASR